MNRRKITLTVAVLVAAFAFGVLTGPAAAQFGRNKIRYDKFEWRIYNSPHFEVFYYAEGEELLPKVVSYAESAYDELSQKFNFKIEEQTPLIFYLTHAEFEQNNIILNFIPEGVGAFASPVRNRMVLPIDLPGPELYELILHELTHIFEYHILFGANLGKGIASVPPTWFMEGLASYMAEDEGAREKMYLRDAVVNDRIPPVTADFQGFFAYRFGHAVFEYIEEQWGDEGLRDFIIETRNTLGARVGRALERTFGVDAEEFNDDFRRWLRKKYLPELVKTGEPGDFGRKFRRAKGPAQVQSSPAASPSGDLLVAFSTSGTAYSNPSAPEIDIVLYDTNEREIIRNLTKGFDRKDIGYFVAQELTMGRKLGRDLAFSPDGNKVAFFVRRGAGRSLALLDVLKGKIDRLIDMDVDQQIAPAFSPDGRSVAFAGHRGGQFDIFAVDLESETVRHLTNDEVFDGAPVYTPDGSGIVLSSVVGDYAKLFRVDLSEPEKRYPLTHGESNETDAVFSPSGRRIYYTSDRSGANNIYSLDLESGEVVQHTNSVTGCFTPTVLAGEEEGKERLVFTAFWKGRFDLYRLDVDEPITEPVEVAADDSEEVDGEPIILSDLPQFEPSIEVAIDERNFSDYGGKRFFIEDVGGSVGLSDDQTFVGISYIQMSDFLGDRRILGVFESIEGFQNFDIIYANLSHRWQWQAHIFDDRTFFTGLDRRTGFLVRDRAAYSQTGGIASLIFPWNESHRFEIGAGYIFREIDFQSFLFDPDGFPVLDDDGRPVPIISPREDDYPLLQAAVVGDTTVASPWGLQGGRRWRFGASWAPDLDESGTLTSSLSLDFRQYLPVSRRSNLAYRLVGYASDGNFPNPFYFGGLDTVRGFDFRSLVGDNGFYSNLEYRFPLIDRLDTPLLDFAGVRGVMFLDIGGAWYDSVQDFDFFVDGESRLEDAVASYGWGVTLGLGGLTVNVDFARRWNFKESESGYESSVWIGRRF